MSSEQNTTDQDLRSVPEGVNLDFPSVYDASPAALHLDLPSQNGTGLVELPAPDSESGLSDNQKEPDLDIGPEQPKGKIWGMKRKTFMIVLGVLIFLIIAVAAGVGGGVGGTAAKSNAHKEASESKTKWQDSPIPIDSSPSPTSSSDHPPMVTSTSSISSSPTPTPIRKNTPLAAVNWNTSNIQLFYKHTDGSIRSQENGGLTWGGQSAQITKPRDDSGLAAIGWLDGDLRQIRVYTTDGNNSLIESVWDGSTQSWFSQDISTGVGLDPPAAGSQLTAYTWSETFGLQIRVYYQGQNGLIREAAFTGMGWSQGNRSRAGKSASPIEDFPQARNGTGLAIVQFPDTNERGAKLFYQSMGGELMSFDYKRNSTFDGSWQNQDPSVHHGSIPDGTHLTAVLNRSGDMTLRIYFIRGGKLREIWWTKKGGWTEWDMHNATAPGVAAVSYSDDVHVFFQTETEYLSAVGLNRLVSKWQFIEAI